MTQKQLLAAYLNVAFFGDRPTGSRSRPSGYFSVPASKLTLVRAADLAGIVQSPTAYDPKLHPQASTTRRNEVLNRMQQLHYISKADAVAAEKHPDQAEDVGRTAADRLRQPAGRRQRVLLRLREHVLSNNYPAVWNEIIKGSGGLTIYTTLNMRDQIVADRAVNFVQPHVLPHVQPWSQRRRRGTDQAGLRGSPGHRDRPEVRQWPGRERGRLRGQQRVRRRRGRADRIVVEAVHARSPR